MRWRTADWMSNFSPRGVGAGFAESFETGALGGGHFGDGKLFDILSFRFDDIPRVSLSRTTSVAEPIRGLLFRQTTKHAVRRWNEKAFVVEKESVIVQTTGRFDLEMCPKHDFRISQSRLIRQLRLLQLEPFLLGGALFQFRLERQRASRGLPDNCRYSTLPLGVLIRNSPSGSTRQRLTFSPRRNGFSSFADFLSCLHQPVARRRIDDEGLVEAGHDAAERRAIDLAERLLALDDLVAQPRQRLVLETARSPRPAARAAWPATRSSKAASDPSAVASSIFRNDSAPSSRRLALAQRQDRRIGGDALENLQIAEIDHSLDRDVVAEKLAQILARAGAEEGRGRDVAEPAAVLEQRRRRARRNRRKDRRGRPRRRNASPDRA